MVGVFHPAGSGSDVEIFDSEASSPFGQETGKEFAPNDTHMESIAGLLVDIDAGCVDVEEEPGHV